MDEREIQDIQAIANLPYDWKKLIGKTIFISGGTGFIGQFLINVLMWRNKKYGNKINVISCSRKAQAGFEKNLTYISHDITQPIKFKTPHIDYIIHLASNTHPKQYAIDPIGTITTNVFGAYNLLNFAVQQNAKRFLLASSVEIYGEGNGSPIKEDYSGYLDCNTVRAGYNEAKRVSESLCQSFIAHYGLDCVITRLARCFGADRKNDSKAIAQFISCAVNNQDIVLKSTGNQRFSYCYVADAVSAILKILLDGQSGEAYNVASDDEGLTLGDYACKIASYVGKKVCLNIIQDDATSKASYAVLDNSKLKSLGWKPIYSISTAIERTIDILKILN